MKDILLAAAVLAFFVLGYYAADRFGKFMDEIRRDCRRPSASVRKIYVTGTEGKSRDRVIKEIRTILDSLPYQDRSEIMICIPADPCAIECLKRAGYSMETDLLPDSRNQS